MWGSEHFSTIPRSSCREPTTTAAACTVRVRIYMQETSRCDIDTVMAKEMYYPNEGKTLIKNKITKFEAGQVLIWRTYQPFLPVFGFISDNTVEQDMSRAFICGNTNVQCISLFHYYKKREESLYDHGRLIKI